MAIQMYDLAANDDRLRFSPYCWRARMALAHKGLAVETLPVRFGEKDKIAFSGQKLVPVIRDGDKVVCDSWDIAIYLDDAYPDRPLLMAGEHGKALSNVFRYWAQMRIGPAIMRIVLIDIWASCSESDREYFRSSREARFNMSLEEFVLPEEEGRKNLHAELAPFREALKEQDFACGSEPAFADYILLGAFMWARGISRKKVLEHDDPVYSWRERMLDLFDGLARTAPGLGT